MPLRKTVHACAVAAVLAMTPILPAQAGTEFGTDQEVRDLIARFVAFAKENGEDAATAALKDPSTEFGGAKPGLMIWVDNKMGAHNKFPDLAGIDFAEMQDLRGRYVIKEFTAAADKGGDYTLNYWPIYGGEKEYEYHCFSIWIESPRVLATACR